MLCENFWLREQDWDGRKDLPTAYIYPGKVGIFEGRRRKGSYAEICGLGGSRVETGEKTYPRPIYRRKIGIFPSPRAYTSGFWN